MSHNIVADVIILLSFLALLLILVFVWTKLERLLDRYRLKYGFDREIEGKDTSGDNKEEKLNRSERLFKRRVFKD